MKPNLHDTPHPVEGATIAVIWLTMPVVLVLCGAGLIIAVAAGLIFLIPLVVPALLLAGVWGAGVLVYELYQLRSTPPADPTWRPNWKRYGINPVDYDDL